MSPKDFEKQVQDELRNTENLIYYLAGRLETKEPANELEHFQSALESNKALIIELYKRLMDKKEGK